MGVTGVRVGEGPVGRTRTAHKKRTANNKKKRDPQRLVERQQRALVRERARTAARRRKRMRAWALPSVLLAAIAGGVAFAIAMRTPAPPARAEPPPVLGEASAPVVLTEWGDFQCPSCGAFARNAEPELRRRFIETGKVRLEWHDFAWYGPESNWAANAARCAGDQGKFWEYHDHLYEHQGGTNTGAFAKSRLSEFARAIGLDGAAFDACLEQDSHLGAVRADMEQVRELGLVGTPTFFVNGRQISASPQELFAAIEAELAAL